MDITSPELMGFSSQRLARIKTVMQRYVEANKFAGFITLVARHGKVVHLEKTGYADIASAKRMANDTLFRMYSQTKPVTATALLMLMEQGHFRLSDPLYAYLPAFKDMQVLTNDAGDTEPAKRPITLQNLFTHTAGLGYGIGTTTNPLAEQMYVENFWMPIITRNVSGMREVFERIARLPLVAQPGEAWIYSVAIDVLGLLVEVISGMPLAQYMQRNLFDPLGMTDTGFYVPPEKLGRLATTYGAKGSNWLKPPTPEDLAAGIEAMEPIVSNGSWTEPTNTSSGGGGLLSTAPDYLRFAQMIANKGTLDGTHILGRKTVELMFANHLPAGLHTWGNPALGHGLGGSVVLDVAQNRMLGSLGEWSWGGAANTEFWVDPVEDMVCLLMAQFMPGGSQPVNVDFHNLVYQALVD